jgi:hypothetical protein
MGYRSDVIIAVTKKAYNKFADQDVRDVLKTCDTVTQNKNGYYFHFNSIKWYSDYEEIKKLDKFIDDCIEDDFESIGFLRIGEDDDDIERRGEPYIFDVSMERSIGFPEGKEVNEIIFACNSIRYIVEEEDDDENDSEK